MRENAVRVPRSMSNVIWFELGRNLKNARLKKGLTMGELANKAQTGRSFIAKLEAGDRRLHADWIEKFSKALNVTTDELTQGIPLTQLRKHMHLKNRRSETRNALAQTAELLEARRETVHENGADIVSFREGDTRITVDFAKRSVDVARIVRSFPSP